MNTIGFIGAGNITKAILKGILGNNPSLAKVIWVSNRSNAKLQELKVEYPELNVTMDNNEVAKQAGFLFLAVKPNMYEDVIKDIRDSVRGNTIVICPAAGLSISYVEQLFEKPVKVVRCMPNTPSMLGLGMTAICMNKYISGKETPEIKALFKLFGNYEVVEESMFDVVTGVSGSGPAYVYMFVNAMAKAAEKDGMTREQAVNFAAQTALGASQMILSSGIDPETLTKNVCSPGGTTIEAVTVFEEDGLEDLVYKAQHACVEKSKKLSK